MASRTEQRRAAVWALYQADLLDRPLEFSEDTHRFTRELAEAVRENQGELDLLIRRYSKGWTLNRIAPLERSILRVALLEITQPEAEPGDKPIPPEGAIDEAVETAKEFCGADAPKFVNGVLAAALRDMQSGAA